MTHDVGLHEVGPPEIGLLETMRLQHGRFWLLAEHLQRLQRSAAFFGMRVPHGALEDALMQHAAQHPIGLWRSRLVVGENVQVSGVPLPPKTPGPWRVVAVPNAVRADDVALQHKTTRRGVYDQCRAAHAAHDEVLLCNERGLITEFATGNVVVRLAEDLFTPPTQDGLLPGVLRAVLLGRGVLRERSVSLEEAHAASDLWFINSVRGVRRVVLERV